MVFFEALGLRSYVIVRNLIGFRVLGLESKTGALWRGKIKLKNVQKSLKFRCGTFSCIWGPIWGPIIAQKSSDEPKKLENPSFLVF